MLPAYIMRTFYKYITTVIIITLPINLEMMPNITTECELNHGNDEGDPVGNPICKEFIYEMKKTSTIGQFEETG